MTMNQPQSNLAPARHHQERLLKLGSVLQIFPASRSAFLQGVKDGRYPRPLKIGLRAVAWRESDIQALIQKLPTAE